MEMLAENTSRVVVPLVAERVLPPWTYRIESVESEIRYFIGHSLRKLGSWRFQRFNGRVGSAGTEANKGLVHAGLLKDGARTFPRWQ